MKKSKVQVLSVVICVAIILSIIGFTQTLAADEELEVDFSTVIQDDFLGVNAIYHGFAFMPESSGMSSADREREFDRVQRSKLKIARTWYRPDWVCGDDLKNTWDWESTKMEAFYDWLDVMKALNVDVALQAGWWWFDPVHGGDLDNDWESYLPDYCKWVSDSVDELITERGYDNIKYLFMLTEPVGGGRNPDDFASSNLWYKRVVEDVDAKLTTDGRRSLVDLVVGNASRFTGVAEWCSNNMDDAIDIYSEHGYNYADYDEWFAKCDNLQDEIDPTGKDVWLDEYGKQDESYRNTTDYGTHIAEIAAASINAGNQTSLLWIFLDQQYVDPLEDKNNGDSFHNGVHRWGTAFYPADTVTNPTYIRPHWYAYTMMSRYMGGRNDTKVYDTTSTTDVKISATKPNNIDNSFLVINTSDSSKDISVDLSSALNKTLYRYVYDPNNIGDLKEVAPIIGYDKTFTSVGTNFTDTIPARGVIIYSTIKHEKTYYGFLDEFDDGDTAWRKNSGTWSVDTIDNDSYKQSSGTNPSISSIKTDTWGDATFEFDMKLETATWAGIQIRKTTASAVPWSTGGGYMIYVNQDGKVALYKTSVGVIASVDTSLNFSDRSKTIKVVTSGTSIKVYVNGESTAIIDETDSSYSSGYVSLITYQGAAFFDNVDISGATPTFSDDFESGDGSWNKHTGTWAVADDDDKTFKQTVTSNTQHASIKDENLSESATYNFYMKVTDTNSTDWAGMQIRKSSETASPFSTSGGYLIYAMKSGRVALYGYPGVIASSETGLDFNNYQHISIVTDGSSIKVYVNGELEINATDTTHSSGYTGLCTYQTGAHFDDVNIYNTNPANSKPVKTWDFDTTTESWTTYMWDLSGFGWQTGGYIGGNITGIYPAIRSADSLALDIDGHSTIKLRMKTSSGATYAKFYFITDSDTTWDATKSVEFAVIDDNEFHTYAVDMSVISGWAGTLKRLRLDPNQPGASGRTFSVDYISIVE
jgi:hypothetical protein